MNHQREQFCTLCVLRKSIKGLDVVFEKKFKLRNIILQYLWSTNSNSQMFVFFLNWINKLFSEENKVPKTLFEARKLAGSATYKQWNSMKLCCPFRSVCIQTWKQFVYLVCSGTQISVYEYLSLIIFSFTKRSSAPLIKTYSKELNPLRQVNNIICSYCKYIR